MLSKGILNKLFNSVVLYRNRYFNIVTYGFLYALGFLLVVQLFFANWYRLGYSFPPHFVIFMTLVVPCFVVIFSKLIYLFYNLKRLFKTPLVVLNETGYAFFGGFLGIAVASLFLQKYILPGQGIQMLDTLCLFLPLGMVLMRIGCATYGCCYGHAYSGPIAIVYKNPQSKALRSGKMKNTPVHPSPLYSIFKNIFIFIIINVAFLKFPYVGVPSALWLILYGILRFFVDFTRFIQPPYFWGLRPTQLFSLIVFSSGVYLLIHVQLNPYKFIHSFNEGFMHGINYLNLSLLGFLILLIGYGFHGPVLGHYFQVKKRS